MNHILLVSILGLASPCVMLAEEAVDGGTTKTNEAHKTHLEWEKADTKIAFKDNTRSSVISAILSITNHDPNSHTIVDRLQGDMSWKLIDNGRRFASEGNWKWSVVSGLEVSFGGKPISLNRFPSNQIYGFIMDGTYGSFPCYNSTTTHPEYDLNAKGRAINMDRPRIITSRRIGGTYITPNETGDSILVNLAGIYGEGDSEFLFSAILARNTGEWFIFPEDYTVGYYYQQYAKTTILEQGGQTLPGTPRKICYEYNEKKKPIIRLILEVTPDSKAMHKIEEVTESGRKIVLIDGKSRMYDPASPIQWRLCGAQAWWDGQPVKLKNFPDNHFFNFPIFGAGWPASGRVNGVGLGLLDGMQNTEPNCIGIYPSTDRNALYVAFARTDSKSGILSYGVLVIQRDGRCDVFPESFDLFVNDKGQNIQVLEGYSDRALKKAPPFVPKPKPTQKEE